MATPEHACRGTQIINKIKQEVEDLGGADLDFVKYEQPDSKSYCEKGGHRLRSIANSEQHKQHFKKEGVIYEH